MSTKPRPPIVSTGRTVLVTTGFVIASVVILALAWRVLVATGLCIYCNTSLNDRPLLVSLMLTVAIHPIGLLVLVASPGPPRTYQLDSGYLVYLMWVTAPLLFASAYWFAQLRLRLASALRTSVEAALLMFGPFVVLIGILQVLLTITTPRLSLVDTYLRIAVIAIVGAALAVGCALLLTNWRAVRASVTLSPAGWSGPTSALRVFGVTLACYCLVPLLDFLALLALGGRVGEHPGDGYTLALVIQYLPAFLIVILSTRNTLQLLPGRAALASGKPSLSTRAGGWLSSLGGALSLIGHFAPWALLTGAFLLLNSCGGRTSHDGPPSGADLAWQNDLALVGGLVIVGAALAALVIGLSALRHQPALSILLFLLAVTLVSAGVLVYEAALLIGGAFSFDGAPAIVFVEFAPGFWASAAGAALSLVGAMVLLVVSRRDPTAPSAHATTRAGDATEQGASGR